MPDRRPLSQPDAHARALAWLDHRHERAHKLVAELLATVPPPAVVRALEQLTTGQLHLLALQLAQAAGLEVDLHAGTIGPPTTTTGRRPR
jgi:hypothetical protein